MVRTNQIPLDLKHPVSFDLTDYVVSSSNADAYHFVEEWPQSGAHFGAIVGPRGAGKSHLLRGWAQTASAQELVPDADLSSLATGRHYFIDDVNQLAKGNVHAYSDSFLFHAFNWAKEKKAHILVTDIDPPTQWRRKLPDLRSRMGTVPIASIHQPDDDLIKVLLIKLFSDRQLQVNIEVVDYIVGRMPRSFAATVLLADSMDRLALAERRKITKPLAKRCLDELEDLP